MKVNRERNTIILTFESENEKEAFFAVMADARIRFADNAVSKAMFTKIIDVINGNWKEAEVETEGYGMEKE